MGFFTLAFMIIVGFAIVLSIFAIKNEKPLQRSLSAEPVDLGIADPILSTDSGSSNHDLGGHDCSGDIGGHDCVGDSGEFDGGGHH